MNRAQFFATLDPLDAGRLRGALWELYWRGGAPLRARIEEVLKPKELREARQAEDEVDGPELVASVQEFVALARSGAYIAGTREVSRQERSRWRFTFRQLVDDAARLLGAADFDHGASALAALIDLACECRERVYFHSEDPVEAMKLVVSDRVQLLWRSALSHEGFGPFVRRAAPQLIRWESPFGWTITGFGSIRQKERTLASVLRDLLKGIDAWIAFADAYLTALDALAAAPRPEGRRKSGREAWLEQEAARQHEFQRSQRSRQCAEWHGDLLERLGSGDAEDRIARLLRHPALGGPELTFVAARWAHMKGNLDQARRLATQCLEGLPGHAGFLRFAQEIDAPIPARAQEVINRRRGAPEGAGA